MSTIAFKIGVKATPAQAIEAINTIEGLSSWWTESTSGSTEEGGVIQFRFGDSGPDMRVESSSSDRVIWQCLSGPEEWQGTLLEFIVKADEKETSVFFQHKGWPGVTAMYQHCNTKWAAFMFSLKHYLDGESARAFPNDIKVCTLGY